MKVEKYSPETNRALIRTLTETELPTARKIKPINGAWIEADLLFPFIRGRNVGRYSHLMENWYHIIPNHHYENTLDEVSFADNYPLAYSYFKNYENILLNRSTYKRYQSHLPFYVIYCIGDYSFSPYKVVWLEQQDPSQFRASVISSNPESKIPNKILVPDHKLYFINLESEDEAHYVCGFLNSHLVSTWLGGFLLGKQIGTSIFEYMKLPKYESSNQNHNEISDISKSAHKIRISSLSNARLDDTSEARLSNLVRQVCH